MNTIQQSTELRCLISFFAFSESIQKAALDGVFFAEVSHSAQGTYLLDSIAHAGAVAPKLYATEQEALWDVDKSKSDRESRESAAYSNGELYPCEEWESEATMVKWDGGESLTFVTLEGKEIKTVPWRKACGREFF
jgi:hypothetical protein